MARAGVGVLEQESQTLMAPTEYRWQESTVRALSGGVDISLSAIWAGAEPLTIVWHGEAPTVLVMSDAARRRTSLSAANSGLLSLQGLGKHIWHTEDAQDYVARLRDEWSR